MQDVVLLSMFQTARCTQFDVEQKKVHISFLKKFMIFQDVLQAQKSVWLFVLEDIFGSGMQAVCVFDGVAGVPSGVATTLSASSQLVQKKEQTLVASAAQPVQVAKPALANSSYRTNSYAAKKEVVVQKKSKVRKVEESELKNLPLAQEVLKHFDGILLEIDGDEL